MKWKGDHGRLTGVISTVPPFLFPHNLLSGRLPVVLYIAAACLCTMTKRKKNINSSEDSTSASEFEITPVSISAAPRRKRRSTTAHKASTDEPAEESASDIYYVTPHPRSQHLIPSPDLMRSSLLRWYSGVHEVRGMPWRKQFDPSLDADARAQRAYEVSREVILPSVIHSIPCLR